MGAPIPENDEMGPMPSDFSADEPPEGTVSVTIDGSFAWEVIPRGGSGIHSCLQFIGSEDRRSNHHVIDKENENWTNRRITMRRRSNYPMKKSIRFCGEERRPRRSGK
ncbi:hypothetical protein RB195_021196 [Necator americanus]|uniref:Uncharacterized protein n=1 Tax=Necator americanus TaxID=51031 RepID=A0ABR1E9U4_NECAM